ncbi:MAG: DNA-binding protein [Anaerolinea sp.]|nr:DNA-binding protein [Anaerolinea sp.]
MLITDLLFDLNNPLLKASEVARLLNISRAKAYRLLSTGQIPTVRIDKSIRVRSEDLQSFLKSNWIGVVNNQ